VGPPPATDAPSDRGAAPAAGWYSDPVEAGLVRWWDGASWTAHCQERPAAERDS
jgi:hypothetical protein